MSPDKIFIYVNDRRVSLAEFKAMPADQVRTVYASGCTALTELKADAAKTVYASGCTALTELKADAAEYVDARGCTALTELKADAARVERSDDTFRYLAVGCDNRGFLFEGMRIRGQWRVVAGCRNFSIEDARKHWGKDGWSDRPDCLALVEKIAALIREDEVLDPAGTVGNSTVGQAAE